MAEALKVPLYDVEKNFKPTTVCVTGSTGYVAGSIVERLLAAGHTVHATCRDPSKEKSVGHLKELEGAEDRLKLFRAELLQEGSFAEAVQGCTCVMHTASPFIATVPKGKEKEVLIDPALRGTENVLAAVNAVESVKRVILTASCASVYGDPDERGPDHIFTEEDWVITASETELAYYYSKKVAEERAYEICKAQSRWTLCSILPALILGPQLSPHFTGESVSLMKQLIEGKMWPAAPKIGMGLSDIRDVSAAHCVTMCDESASGRYIVTSGSFWVKEWGDMLRTKYPKAYLPKTEVSKFIMRLMRPFVGLPKDQFEHNYGKIPRFDNSRAKGLGLKFVDPTETVCDMVQRMGELGVIKLKGVTT